VKLLTIDLAVAHNVGRVLNAEIATDSQRMSSAEIGVKEPWADKCATRQTLNLVPTFAGSQNARTRANSLAADLPVRVPMPRYQTIRSHT
jgi:hypothetical protein